jgi:hypothetical protein
MWWAWSGWLRHSRNGSRLSNPGILVTAHFPFKCVQCGDCASRRASAAMAEYVCDRCGEVNPVGTVFCVNCHAFLAWDQVECDERLEGEGAGSTGGEQSDSEQNVETRVIPQIRVPANPPNTSTDKRSSSLPAVPNDSTESLFRIVAEQRGVTVPATGEPATLTLRVMNTSAIVDGYVVEAPGVPEW